MARSPRPEGLRPGVHAQSLSDVCFIYSRHAARAARLAQLASTWAKETDSPNGRALFESESAWFAHKALVYRSMAFGYGLIRVVFPGFASPTGDDRELILDLGISEVIDWHEANIVREHARLYPLPET